MEKTGQQKAEPAYTRRQIFMALATVFLVYLVYSYYIQTPGIAAPKMAADLDGMALYSWSVSIPGLGLAFGTILVGKLSDIYGRRSLLLASLIIFTLGAILSAVSPTYIFLIAARTILCLGQGALSPLVFSVLGDMFPPAERSRLVGLLNIPTGIFAVFGPTLGGWLTDTMSWRHIFWLGVPLLLICFVFLFGMPALVQGAARQIDIRGCLWMAFASSALIFGFSFAGTTYPWASVQVIGLLAVSIICSVFFIRAEAKAAEPILDLQVLRNRSFITVSGAGLLSFFGSIGIMLYYPLLMQGIQGVSAMRSGQILTPYGVLSSFIGVPTGFLLARTKRYKWMYVAGYAIMAAAMCGMIFFDADTSILWGLLICTLSGIGLGAIPTINTLVVQYAVPKRLLGVAMGALFFSISMGVAIAPAILGSAMNMQYNSTLKASLPAELTRIADDATMTSLGNPRVLLSEPAMKALNEMLGKREGGERLFEQTVQAIRASMEAGLKSVFIIGALTMVMAFLLICTVPEIPMEDKS